MVWVSWCFEDFEEKGDGANHLMNGTGVYRTAPATLGLLNKLYIHKRIYLLYFPSFPQTIPHTEIQKLNKLYRIGPIDNRPSTN